MDPRRHLTARQRKLYTILGRHPAEVIRDAVYGGMTYAEAGKLFSPAIDASMAWRWLDKYEKDQASEPVAVAS